jgi:FlaA1/EpsC-like NDP-sugar epimerase
MDDFTQPKSGFMQRHRLQIIDLLLHLVTIVFSLMAATFLRFDLSLPAGSYPLFLKALLVAVIVKSPVFYLAGFHRHLWRFAEVADLLRLIGTNVLASALFTAAAVLCLGPTFPRSIYIIDLLICCLLTILIRYSARIRTEMWQRERTGVKRRKILIYGAGAAGATLLRETRANRALGYEVAGFLDDDPAKRGALIMGVAVLGNGRQAASIGARFNRRRKRIEEIVIAMPSASGREKREALANCQASLIPCKTLPSLSDMLSRKVLAEQIRDVALADLLGRPPVQLSEESIQRHLAGRCVMVTGAGGTIGSELCRQVARFSPSRLIAFDQAESDLFRIECELREHFPNLDLQLILGDIRDAVLLDEVFDHYSIDSVFHAAAYKHVPMMEFNVLEAAQNNILATWNLVQVAQRRRVSSFLMISSDKAVNPTSVMGATKRVCELIVSAMGASSRASVTKFVSVRFGNVLGSNGSVVPIFQSQIATGGPVKVTHPDIQRYFMTASEAVSLVLQASTMGAGSEIFVLDMGEPIRIIDLAVNMIRLAGLVPYQDIDIRFTGLRPGEKLFEEINSLMEQTLPTFHTKIKIFQQAPPSWSDLSAWIAELKSAVTRRNPSLIVEHIREVVPEYRPADHHGVTAHALHARVSV